MEQYLEQRVEILEKELTELKTIVHQMCKPSIEVAAALNEQTIECSAAKTPNQLRAEIIEKAKGFVKKHGTNFHFIIKDNRIVAFDLDTWKHGHSICSLSDVFNEHIGKAIALGRALGLDVSEFTSAVQPNEKMLGMLIKNEKGVMRLVNDGRVASHDKDGIWCCAKDSNFARRGAIINDTNAIYKEVTE